MENKQILTPEEVGTRLGLKTKTVKDWLRVGKIRGVKVGKLWRVKESDLQDYINGLGKNDS